MRRSRKQGRRRPTIRLSWVLPTVIFAGVCGFDNLCFAAGGQLFTEQGIDVKQLLRAGGWIGYVIIFLSFGMLALVIEHLFSIRRGSLQPRGQAEQLFQHLQNKQIEQALSQCRRPPSFLGHVVAAGLQEVSLGHVAVEKSMEDASASEAARLFRKIEYLSVIGTLAPMLGLMGTVWGMIQAFGEFAAKANPTPADFAPAISEALVTTLLGLCVAIPALAAFAVFRNRIDELVADVSLTAEHVIGPVRRTLAEQRRTVKAATAAIEPAARRVPVPPIAREQEPS